MPVDPRKIPTSPSQKHLDIEDIRESIVLLKDGGACIVLATTAINFGLLSEKEQDATIYAYAGLLNSLTFSIQIVIRSAKKDISSYLKLLEEQEKKQKKELLVEQIRKYRAFVEETVKQNEVLDKKFYIVIPMTALELGVTKAATSVFKRKKGLPFPKDYILERAKTNLYPKRDHLIRLMSRLGLQTRQLASQELIQLFFSIYNPEARGQKMAKASEYKAPLVEPAIEGSSLPQPTAGPSMAKVQPPSPPASLPGQPSPVQVEQVPPLPAQPQAEVGRPLGETSPPPLPSSQPAPPTFTPSLEPEKMEESSGSKTPLEGEALQRQIDNLIKSTKKR